MKKLLLMLVVCCTCAITNQLLAQSLKTIYQISIFIAGIFAVPSQTLYSRAQLGGSNNSDVLALTNVGAPEAIASTTTVAFVATPLPVTPLRQVLVEKLKTRDKINLDLFVMSQCPFGVQAEETIIPLLARFGGRITIKFHYVASIDQNQQVQSMHGKDEVDEDQRQLIIGYLYPDRLQKYLLARAKNYQSNNWKSVAESLGISTGAVKKMMQSKEGKKIFLKAIQTSMERRINSSPTLYIDDQKYAGIIMPTGINDFVSSNINSVNSINSVSPDQCTGLPDGTACNDGNACTLIDVCVGGAVCVGTTPVICNGNNTCNPVTGSCGGAGVSTVNTDYFRSITSGNWSTPAIWESSPVSDFSSGVVNPATLSPDDNANAITIRVGHIVSVISAVTADQVSVDAGGTLEVASGTLNIVDGTGNDLDVNGIVGTQGRLSFTSGSIQGAGLISINNNAVFTWTGGLMQGSGTTNILSTATASFSGSGVNIEGTRTINNNSASFTHSGPGNIALGNGTTFNNTAGAAIIISGDGGFTSNGGTATLTNNGTITKSGGSGVSYWGNAASMALFNNGVINANSGIITLGGSGTHTGNFNVASGKVIRFENGTQSLSSAATVTGNGTLDFNGATVTLDAGSTISTTVSASQSSATVNWNNAPSLASLTYSGGSMQGSGVVGINAVFTWTGGLMQGSGITNILSTATASFSGSGVNIEGTRTINNNSASFTHSGPGNIALGNGTTFNNTAGAAIIISGDGGFTSNGGTATLTNNGTITKSGGSGVSYWGNAASMALFNNGVINANSGIITLGGSGTHTGNFNVASGKVIRFENGTQSLSSAATVTGNGTLDFNGATVTLDAGSTISTTVSASQSSATVNWNNAPSLASLTYSGGSMQGSGVVGINAVFTWTGGLMQGSGITNILSTATASFSGSGVNIEGTRTINNNSASFTHSGPGNIALGNGTTFNNTAGAAIIISGDGGFTSNGGTATITNNGTITKSSGSGVSYLSNSSQLTFNNSSTGIINVNSGTISLNGSGTHNGMYNIAAAKILSGSISMSFIGTAITNNGSITLSGLTFAGASTQALNGTGNINDLTINNVNGVNLFGNQTINNALALTIGTINTGANKIIVGNFATISRTNGWVNKNLELPFSGTALTKSFYIGDATNYTPVLLSFSSISGSGSVLGSQTSAIHPNLGTSTVSSTKRVNRYYSLQPSALSFGSYDATFNYNAGDVLGGANTSNFIVGKYDPTTWSYPTVGTKTATSTQITGETSFSDFAIGEVCTNNFYRDADGDTYGTSLITIQACTAPAGYVARSGDCNDADVAINPGAVEVCGNGIDDNCDGQIDEGCILYTFYKDTDADTYGDPTSSVTNYTGTVPAGYVTNKTDCNDNNKNVNPAAVEICGNGIDDNCNGQIDEGVCGTSSHIFPTATTCCNYVNGPTSVFQLKQVCITPLYGTGTKPNTVGNAIPGVFFYYGDYTATSNGNVTITVQQTRSNNSILAPFNAKVLNFVHVTDNKCNNITVISTVYDKTSGGVTTIVFKATAGVKYVISVKYDTKSIIGTNLPKLPVPLSGVMATYTFGMYVGATNPIKINGSEGSINVTAGCIDNTPLPTGNCPTTLAARTVPGDAIIPEERASKISVTAYPNPFTDKVKFAIVSPVSGKASLDVYNMMGQKILIVYTGYLFANKTQVIDYNIPVNYKGSLIYTLRVGDKQVNGNVIQLK
jgi:hypothetical protein